MVTCVGHVGRCLEHRRKLNIEHGNFSKTLCQTLLYLQAMFTQLIAIAESKLMNCFREAKYWAERTAQQIKYLPYTYEDQDLDSQTQSK